MIIPILVLLLILASFVVAYFSARTWHWSHVVLVMALFLSSVGFLILSAETLRIHAILQTKAKDLEGKLAVVQVQNVALEKGTRDGRIISQLANQEVRIPEGAEKIPGIFDLDHKLHLETRVRGRVWRNVAPAGFDPPTETVRAMVNFPQPSGIDSNTILFLFEQGEPTQPDPSNGPQYLGQFRVSEVNDAQVTLVSVFQLDDFDRKRLARSPGPWMLYETMPVDRHSLFANRTGEQLRQWLPAQSIEEYLRQGTEAGPDDEPLRRASYDASGNRLGPEELDRAVRTLYERRLRDYGYEFEELASRQVLLLAGIGAMQKENERLKEALEGAGKLKVFREDEIEKLNVDLAGVTKERAAIEKHLALVQRQLAENRRKLAETLQKNNSLAKLLAKIQSTTASVAQ